MVYHTVWVVMDTVEEPFRKNLTHLTWDEVYARQVERAALVGDWMAALRLKRGDRVLEIGSGPGYVSLVLADRVGPTGVIYAVELSAEALAHLERLQKERGVSNIQRLVADASTLESTTLRADAALISMVLHHADDPAGILSNVARLLSPGGRAVIAEFHPDGPCNHGPPQSHRLTPGQIQTWCEAVGLLTLEVRRQSPEHYMVLVQRSA
jgi:ubiquinone/menaquinone biosynthesis C-methylase UbiE